MHVSQKQMHSERERELKLKNFILQGLKSGSVKTCLN